MAKLITFEGIDGAGKTSCLNALGQHLENLGHKVKYAKERDVVNDDLTQALAPFMMGEKRKQLSQIEILLVILAIRSHYHDKILSDLLREKDTIVLMDRYIDSTFAYNFSNEFKNTCEYMNMTPITMFNMLHHLATHGDYITPDRTYLLDIDIDSGYIYSYNRDGYALYTKKQLYEFRQNFLYLGGKNRERIVTIDSNRPLQNVKMDIVTDFDAWWKFHTGKDVKGQ